MKNKRQKGFTLVELLVVIAIIGLLSSIGMVALDGARKSARDARRLNDMRIIQQALEMYYLKFGTYPNTPVASWEKSNERTYNFMSPLRENGFLNRDAVVDPINNATYAYLYYHYTAGYWNPYHHCGDKDFYVLGITNMETSSPNPHPLSPGFACTEALARDYQATFPGGWVTGKFAGQ